METFYTDKSKVFKCDLEIDGASIDETFARLSLSFDDDKTHTKYVYDGKINENGQITVKVPRIKNAPSMEGKVTLEVIAESTYFEAWEGDFKIKRHKNVSVKKINEDTEDDDDGIKINVIKEDSEPERDSGREKIVEDNSVDKLFELLEKASKIKSREPEKKSKISESIRKLMTEDDDGFDFLSMDRSKKEQDNETVLSSKDFQTNFVRDIVNKSNNVKFISSKMIDDDTHPLSSIMDSGTINMEIETKYEFGGKEYKLDIIIEGDKWYDKKPDLSDFEFKIFTNVGKQVKFDWVKKNEKLHNAFISRLVLPNLK